MYHRSFRLTVLLFFAISLVCSGIPLIAGEVTVEEDIVYAERGDLKLQLDLARPAEDGSMRPAVVCIHGGGWRGGHRKGFSGLIRDLASRGYVALTVSYRLTQVASWPAQLEDVRDAVRWLRRHAEKYGVDPQRVGVVGASAGGHLSLMLGLLPDGQRGEDTRVQVVVNYFGPTDMRKDVFPLDEVDRMIEALAGGRRAEKASTYADLSPITHVSRGDSPVLTFQGTEDALVPVDQARELHRALEEAKVPNRLEILEGHGHGWKGEVLERTQRLSFEFFSSYLKPSDHPLIIAEDFNRDAERWESTDSAAWKVVREGGRTFYSLHRQSKYQPPVRSPLNISLLRDAVVGDFTLEVAMRSTGRVYGHQDLCLFFGHQDPSHFYYVHLGRKADPHANSIFIVDGEPRLSIAKERTSGTDWSDQYHRVRVRREVDSGRIEVYFDDMRHPAMVANDRTFLHGRVGLGSFDDTGDFDSVRLWGKEANVEPPAEEAN